MQLNLNKIKGLMAEKNISGLQMAHKLSISSTSFYLKINGKRPFSAEEIGVMAKALETTPNFFYNACY